MRTPIPRDKHPVLKRLVLALMGAALLSLPLSVSGNPAGPVVQHGQASFARPNANSLVVTNSPGAIIQWQGFSIAQGELTRFVQQSAQSAVLNRVVAANPSLILGQLTSNGRVFLINPAGIAVGPGGVVDTAGFVASTLNMTNADFLAGRLRFEGGPGSGPISNSGQIIARDGGAAILVAPTIGNSGLIRSEGGTVVLAAGQKLEVASLDSPSVRFEVQAPQGSAVNLGRIEAAGGAVGVFAGTLRHSGSIRADTVRVDGAGTVILTASKDIALEPGSLVSASGAPGGVHDGGTVRIVAEGTLDMQRGSEIHVDGGPDGGRGGFLELSGRSSIALDGLYTGRAMQPGYRHGSLLIDPANINIVAGGTDDTGGDGGDGEILAGERPGETLNVAPAALLGPWSDVTLAATQDITVSSPLSSAGIPAGGSLTLDAGRNLSVDAAIGQAAARFDHDLTLRAGNRLAVNAPIHLNGNTLTARGDVIAIGARVDVGGAGTLVLDAVTGSTQTAPIIAGTLDLRGAGAVHDLPNLANQVATLRANTARVTLATGGSIAISGAELAGLGNETLVLSPGPLANAGQGERIVVSGDVMAVGAAAENGRTGAVYLYRWNGAAWVFEQKLVSPDPDTGDGMPDRFGASLAVEGDLLVVGAYERTEAGVFRSGAGYTYRHGTGGWAYTGKLSFTERTFESTFGHAMDMEGGRLVVGGVGRTTEGGFWTGKIWFFDYVGGTGTGWVERGNAIQSDPQDNDYFGYSLDISGNRMLVGAYMATPLGTTGAGKAYVFDFNPATRQWVQTQRLTASNPQGNAHFGMDVSIAGDVAVVGAAFYDGGGLSDSGAAYVFRRGATSWAQDQILTRAAPAASDVFGYRVAASSSLIAVSGHGVDAGGLANAGAAYVYTHDATGWNLARELAPAVRAASDSFGFDIFADSRGIYAGATAHDRSPVADAGAVYVFDAAPTAVVSSGLEVSAAGSLTQTGGLRSGGPVRYRGDGIAIDGLLDAGTNPVRLQAVSSIVQSEPLVTAGGVEIVAPAASVALTHAANSVARLAANVRSLDFSTASALEIGTVGATTGITASGSVAVGSVGDATDLRVSGSVINLGGTSSIGLAANRNVVVSNGLFIGSEVSPTGVTLNADRDESGGGGIRVGSSTLRALGASIVLGGGGSPASTPAQGLDGSDTVGVSLDGAVLEAASVRIAGAGGAGTGGSQGVRMSGGRIESSGGIAITGSAAAGASGSGNAGVELQAGARVLATGTGTVTMVGSGGGGTFSNSGVAIGGTGTSVEAADGTVTITGTAGGTGSNNTGVAVSGGAVVATTGAGRVALTGTGGAGTDAGMGVIVVDAGSRVSTAGSGAIAIVGIGAGTGIQGHGVAVFNSGLVESFGTGAIAITGASGSAGTSAEGVHLSTGAMVRSAAGRIDITGTAAGPGSGFGVALFGGADVIALGAGGISITGTAQGTGAGIGTGSGLIEIGSATASGDIVLSAHTAAGADAIGLGNAAIRSSGTVTLQPVSPVTAIGIAGGTGVFNLEAGDLAALQDGFAGIVIGRPDSRNSINVGAYAFSDRLTLRNPGPGAPGIFVDGALSTAGNDVVFQSAGTVALRAAVDAGGGTVDVTQAAGILMLQGSPSVTAGRLSARRINVLGNAILDAPTTTEVLSMTLTAGSLGGSGDLTVTGSATWNGGVWSGNGTTTVAAGATLGIGGNPILERNLTLQGGLNWSGGTLAWNAGTLRGSGNVTVPAGGELAIGGPAAKRLEGITLVNESAAITIGGTGPVLLAGARIENHGTLTLAGDVGLAGAGAGFLSDAILVKSAGADAASLSGFESVDLGGRVEVQSGSLRIHSPANLRDLTIVNETGTLALGGGGSHGGTISVVGYAQELYSGGRHLLAPGTTLAGEQRLTADGILTIPAGTTSSLAGLLHFAGGTLEVLGTLDVTGRFEFHAVDRTVEGGGTGVLNLLAGSANLAGGGGAKRFNAITVNNAVQFGLSMAPGSAVELNDGTVWNNLPGSSLTLPGDVYVRAGRGSATFANAGTIVKAGAAGAGGGLASGSGVLTLNNQGVIRSTAGTLELGAGGTHSGTLSADSGATIALASGAPLLRTGTVFGGAGTVRIDGAAATVGSGQVLVVEPATRFEIASGSLAVQAGASVENRTGTLLLSGGTLAGGGTLRGSVNNVAGTVAPGASPGILTIGGNFAQGPAGVLAIELAGTLPGEYDQLVVGGSASLGGTLQVTMVGGFTGAPGMRFEPILYPAASGDFATVVVPAGAGFEFGNHGIHYGVDIAGAAPPVPPPVPVPVTPEVLLTLGSEVADIVVMPQVLNLQSSFEAFVLDPWLAGDLLWGYEEEGVIERADTETGEVARLPRQVRQRGTSCF